MASAPPDPDEVRELLKRATTTEDDLEFRLLLGSVHAAYLRAYTELVRETERRHRVEAELRERPRLVVHAGGAGADARDG